MSPFVRLGLGPAACAALGLAGWVVAAPPTASARQAAPAAPAAQAMEPDTFIDAETVEFDNVQNTLLLSGNVEVISGNRRLKADRMTVKRTAQNTIDWAKASGHVYLEQKGDPKKASQAGGGGDDLTGTGDAGEYRELDQKANLTGNVVLKLHSKSLTEPGVVTGQRADIDLKSEQSVVTRSSEKQVKVVLKPKGKPVPQGQAAPPPDTITLVADKITHDEETSTFNATGSPVLTRNAQKIDAERIWFTMDPATDDLKEAHAEDRVVIDAEDEKEGKLHATGAKLDFDNAKQELVLTGSVSATQTPKTTGSTRLASGVERFVYNVKTGAYSASAKPGERLRLQGSDPTAPPRPAGGNNPGRPGGNR